MQVEQDTAVWMTAAHELSLAELAELSGLTEHELRELVEYGAVNPLDRSSTPWIFSGQCLVTVRTAYRLRQSFELDAQGVALTVSLLERIQALEAQLFDLQARLPRSAR